MGVANIWVCFMNGSMFEHDGLGITYLALIFWKTLLLVDMLEYLNYHVKTRLLLWRTKSPTVHAIKKRIWYDMVGSIPHQKFSFYHLPTRGRAGVKLGDADTSRMYL